MVFLFSPLAVVTLLCVLIVRSLDDGIVKQPPVGAGAGDTGGANAVGELIADRRATRPTLTHANGHVTRDGDATSAAPSDDTVDPLTLDTGFIVLVRDMTGASSPTSPIYIASQLNNWNPGDERFKLSAQSDMRWRLHVTRDMLRGSPSAVEFKFTRGKWELEELNKDFSVPANKRIPRVAKDSVTPGQPPTIEYTIHAWVDTSPNFTARHIGEEYRPVQATGTLRRLQVMGGAGGMKGRPRDLLVWLPPGYDDPSNSRRTYPVLYMHDGQNLFEKHSGAPAEWRADESAATLIAEGKIEPLIIVGVPHGGVTRTLEYIPSSAVVGTIEVEGFAALGEDHVRWLLDTVAPRVRRAFRAAEGPSRTGVGGSSLGGLISLYAASRHPDVFGLVLAESPSLRFKSVDGLRMLRSVESWPSAHTKVYLGVGGREAGIGDADDKEKSAAYEQAVRDCEELLRTNGIGVTHLVYDAESAHNEDAWARRLPAALQFLFPAR
jgi:pullulanase